MSALPCGNIRYHTRPQGDYGSIRSPLGNLPRDLHGPRDIYIRDLHLDTIKVKTRDFK